MENTPNVGVAATNAGNPYTQAASGAMVGGREGTGRFNPFGQQPGAVAGQPLANCGGANSIGAQAYGFSSILDQPLAQCGNQRPTSGVFESAAPAAPAAAQPAAGGARKHFPKVDPLRFAIEASVFPKMLTKINQMAEVHATASVLCRAVAVAGGGHHNAA